MIVGLTGGIGSGKSVVANICAVLGCAVFNSDQAAKEVYFEPAIRSQVIELLGEQSYSSGSLLNKSHISAKIFNDDQLLKQLNGIIHPAVSVAFKNFVVKNPNKIIIKETALLFEANVQKQVDKVLLVIADDALRIKRIMKRDGLTESEVLKKIKSQWPQKEKIKGADFIISNNETEFLTPQVIHILNHVSHA